MEYLLVLFFTVLIALKSISIAKIASNLKGLQEDKNARNVWSKYIFFQNVIILVGIYFGTYFTSGLVLIFDLIAYIFLNFAISNFFYQRVMKESALEIGNSTFIDNLLNDIVYKSDKEKNWKTAIIGLRMLFFMMALALMIYIIPDYLFFL